MVTRRKITMIVLLVFLGVLNLAAKSADGGTQKTAGGLNQASTIPLNADLTVQGNITVQAVLIPRKIAKGVFGGEIADNYAVVQLTINNKSSDAALIVQGVYIDYGDWALAGGGISVQPCDELNTANAKRKYVECTQSSQVASEEYRVVRGQALNAQTWTRRNGIVRGLTLAGTVASGYAFTVSGTKYPMAVAAATGQFIPGFSAFWPDQTIDQINRISDMGYQTNKIISKQGSDIIVCFFPIDRFLSKGFKKLFLDEPALFFSPYEMLVDKKVDMTKILPDKFFDQNMLQQMRDGVPCYLFNSKMPADNSNKTTPPPDQTLNEASLAKYCKGKPEPAVVAALETLKAVSLNTIHVVVDGVMSVDTTTLAAKIEKVTIDGETAQNTWTVKSGHTNTVTGTITGSYLTGATPVIQEAKAYTITKIQAVTDGSTDQALKFSFVLGKSLQPGDHLTFVAEKTTKDSKTAPVESAPFLYVVPATSGSSQP